jgi:hypothetical protein
MHEDHCACREPLHLRIKHSATNRFDSPLATLAQSVTLLCIRRHLDRLVPLTPLKLLEGELTQSTQVVEKMITDNLREKNKQFLQFNVVNLIFDFESLVVDIEDECGISDQRVYRISFDDLKLLIAATALAKTK